MFELMHWTGHLNLSRQLIEQKSGCHNMVATHQRARQVQ